MYCPSGVFQYDTIRRRMVNNNRFGMGSVTINGVDVFAEMKACAERAVQQQLAAMEKKKLRVPHAWKDTKMKEGDKDICMANLKQIMLGCGHYHSCAKCTRAIMLANNECPMCRAKIIGVTRVFD